MVGPTQQYHAVGLLYLMRQHDKVATVKMIQTYGKGALRSPNAICMIIRFIWKIMDEDPVG